jgi:sRNA-binding carbon storage regulator CsrA
MSREYGSLSITLKKDEYLVVGEILVTVVSKKGTGFVVRVNAPKDIKIRRESAKRNEAKDKSSSEASGI